MLCFIFSCKTKKSAQVNPDKPDIYVAYPQAEIGSFSKHNDPYNLTLVKLDRNYMELTVTYSGGCQEHEFKLIGSPTIEKSVSGGRQGIRKVQLVHNAKGDNCKAIKEEKLVFSISNLAEHYELGNKIVLKFENYSDEIEYSFQ